MGLHNRTRSECLFSGHSNLLIDTSHSDRRQALDRIVALYRSFCNEAITLGGYIEAADLGHSPSAAAPVSAGMLCKKGG
jgi:hypothetical protein